MTISPSLRLDMLRRLAAAATPAREGAMIALVPEEASAKALARSGYLPADELHVTVAYLGKASAWSAEQREVVAGLASGIAEGTSTPVRGRSWAAAAFNPTSEDACAALLVGDLSGMSELHRRTWRALNAITELPVPSPHSPWAPHITLGYGLDAQEAVPLADGRTIRFDRLRLAFAGVEQDFNLP